TLSLTQPFLSLPWTSTSTSFLSTSTNLTLSPTAIDSLSCTPILKPVRFGYFLRTCSARHFSSQSTLSFFSLARMATAVTLTFSGGGSAGFCPQKAARRARPRSFGVVTVGNMDVPCGRRWRELQFALLLAGEGRTPRPSAYSLSGPSTAPDAQLIGTPGPLT